MNDIDKNYPQNDIEDGSYYVAARAWYSEIFHSPIAERAYYILILGLAALNLYFSFSAFLSLFPLKPPVPFPLYASDIWEDEQRVKKLSSSSAEDKNAAVMKFMISNYVVNRESYDLKSYELRYRNIWNHSTGEVFEKYKNSIDAANPASPYRQYTDLAKTVVDISAIDYQQGTDVSHAHIFYRLSTLSTATGKEISHTKWRADMTYRYTPFRVDQKLENKNPIAVFFGLTGDAVKGSGEKRQITPMTFTVSDYQSKELLE